MPRSSRFYRDERETTNLEFSCAQGQSPPCSASRSPRVAPAQIPTPSFADNFPALPYYRFMAGFRPPGLRNPSGEEMN